MSQYYWGQGLPGDVNVVGNYFGNFLFLVNPDIVQVKTSLPPHLRKRVAFATRKFNPWEGSHDSPKLNASLDEAVSLMREVLQYDLSETEEQETRNLFECVFRIRQHRGLPVDTFESLRNT